MLQDREGTLMQLSFTVKMGGGVTMICWHRHSVQKERLHGTPILRADGFQRRAAGTAGEDVPEVMWLGLLRVAGRFWGGCGDGAGGRRKPCDRICPESVCPSVLRRL